MDEWKEVMTAYSENHEWRINDKGVYEIRKQGQENPFLFITLDGLIGEAIDHQNIKCSCGGEFIPTCDDCGNQQGE